MTDAEPCRIALVTPWASRAGGGVFEAVAAHCDVLRRIGFTPIVIAVRDEDDARDRYRLGEAEVVTLPRLGPRLPGFAPGMVRAIRDARPDIVHLHGIWMYPSAAARRAARITDAPLVISPHGMMDPWIVSRGRWKKALAKLGYEWASWRDATAFHALTADEAQDIRAATGRGQPPAQDIAVIPNAVELPPVLSTAAAPPAHGRAPILGYLGRIHPKKNLLALIEGWRLAQNVLAPMGAQLAIAGWGDEADVAELNAAIAQADGMNVAFHGPLFGADKAAFIAAARYICLPSHSEGLPMAMLEAWAAGTPTIMSRHCHLPEGIAAGAAMECGTDPQGIASALRAAFGKSDENWNQMSDAARQLARDRFAPDAVAKAWQAFYTRLLSDCRA